MVWGAVLVVSLLALVAYVAVFLVAAATTARRRAEPDPLAGELDAVLEEILGRPVTEPPSRSGHVRLP